MAGVFRQRCRRGLTDSETQMGETRTECILSQPALRRQAEKKKKQTQWCDRLDDGLSAVEQLFQEEREEERRGEVVGE